MKKLLIATTFIVAAAASAQSAQASSCYYWPGDLILGRGGYGWAFDIFAGSYWTHSMLAENFGYHYSSSVRVVHADKGDGCGNGVKSEIVSSLMARKGYEDTWVKWRIADQGKLENIVSYGRSHMHGAADNPDGECDNVGDPYSLSWCNYNWDHEYFCTELVRNSYETYGVDMDETWHVLCGFGGSSQDPEELGDDFPYQECYYWNQQ